MGLGMGSLCGAIIRASLRDANKFMLDRRSPFFVKNFHENVFFDDFINILKDFTKTTEDDICKRSN